MYIKYNHVSVYELCWLEGVNMLALTCPLWRHFMVAILHPCYKAFDGAPLKPLLLRQEV